MRLMALANRITRPELAIAVCVGISTSLILGAHGFERLGNMAPCLLCLDQREAHWAAIGAGIATLAFARSFSGAERFIAAALGALTLLYLFSAGLAGYHAGVEWGFWPGPNACSAGGSFDLSSGADILANLDEPTAGPACSEAAWRMMGISMAGYNTLISLALAGIAGVSCFRLAQSLRDRRVDAPMVAAE